MLAENFDTSSRTMKLQDNVSFKLDQYTIERILGIPMGELPIPHNSSKLAIQIISQDTGISGPAPTADQLISLVNKDLVGDRFVRIFLLIAMIFFCVHLAVISTHH